MKSYLYLLPLLVFICIVAEKARRNLQLNSWSYLTLQTERAALWKCFWNVPVETRGEAAELLQLLTAPCYNYKLLLKWNKNGSAHRSSECQVWRRLHFYLFVFCFIFLPEDVLHTLTGAMSLLRRCRVNAALTIQLFSQLFHFINMWLFNKLVTDSESGLCCHYWGAILRQQLSHIEAWAEKQGLELAADCHLSRIVQVREWRAKRGYCRYLFNCYISFTLRALYVKEHLYLYGWWKFWRTVKH